MTASEEFECLTVAIRAWVHASQSDAADEPGPTSISPTVSPHPSGWEPPYWTLVIDCETTADSIQRLLYGAWRLHIDRTEPGKTCVQEGLIYADDLPERDPAGFALLKRYVRDHDAHTALGQRKTLKLVSRAQFVRKVLWKWARHDRALIVGFNLPFDLTRIAVHASRGRGRNRGAISLRLWQHDGGENTWRPRLILQGIDGQRTLMHFSTTRDTGTVHHRGRFLDLRTAAYAHTDETGLSLERACAAFGIDFTKADVVHGHITAEHIDYCRADVEATAALFRAVHAEHSRHPIDLPAWRAYSGASLGKAHLKALGVKPTVERLGQIPAELCGWGMEAFTGGRAECRIRHHEVPVVYVDFRSMYPTCNALMGTWDLVTAEHLSLDECTAEVQALVESDELPDRCFTPEFWRALHVLVQVDPNGAVLPVRAHYDSASDDFGIGVNPYRSARPQWFALADLVAARLLGEATPKVLRAYRLTPHGKAPDLKPIQLAGDCRFNPRADDLFATLVEQRARIRADDQISPAERERSQHALKILANAGYGIFAELNVQRLDGPEAFEIHAGEDGPFEHITDHPETPGDYCFPPLAATITAGGRLMLAVLEHQVATAGGSFATCDTDSMTIVATKRGGLVACPGGPHVTTEGAPAVRALSWRVVDRIVGRFEQLNPYDPEAVPGSILKIEDENFDERGRQRRLDCFAVSAKRNELTADGQSVKALAHGLGHLLGPSPHWIEEAWEWIRDRTMPAPEWFDGPAVSRLTVSGPDAYEWFAATNKGKPYADQIKPGNFILTAYVDPRSCPPAEMPQPIAAYNADPARWAELQWIDRRTGQSIRIRTAPLDGVVRIGTARILTLGDIIRRHGRQPEAKSLGPDGEPVTAHTVGLLRRRSVQAVLPIQIIGKEANQLHARANGTAAHNHTTTYNPTAQDWRHLVVPTLAAMGPAAVARVSGVGLRTVQRALAHQCTPRPEAKRRLLLVAVQHAREETGARRQQLDRAALFQFVQTI